MYDSRQVNLETDWPGVPRNYYSRNIRTPASIFPLACWMFSCSRFLH